MDQWRIATRKPATYKAPADSGGIDIGWSWRISRLGSEDDRYVNVEVVRGRLAVLELPPVAAAAIETRGRSAVEAILGVDEPPSRLVVSSLGVTPGDPC